VFVVFEEGGGLFEFAALALAAIGLDLAELVERFLELPGETVALDGEAVDQAVGVDDVKLSTSLLIGWISGAVEHVGFKQRDAVEAPRGVDEVLDELSFGGSDGLVFLEELAAVRPWRRALSEVHCLPASVRGPVECCELARLIAERSMAGMADIWGTSTWA